MWSFQVSASTAPMPGPRALDRRPLGIVHACTLSSLVCVRPHKQLLFSFVVSCLSLCVLLISPGQGAAATSFPCENWLDLQKRPWLSSTLIPSSPAACPRGLRVHHRHYLASFKFIFVKLLCVSSLLDGSSAVVCAHRWIEVYEMFFSSLYISFALKVAVPSIRQWWDT